MIHITFLKKLSSIFFLVTLLVSCDKDYNTLGADIVGNSNLGITSEPIGVTAFNEKNSAVETKNLAINKLGVYNNPVFGTTTANFATQLSLATLNPTFTSHVEIESVVLTVPYFSELVSTNPTTGIGTYKLKEIYSSDAVATANDPYDPIDLKVYENGNIINDYDANDNLNYKRYYSDQDADFNTVKVGALLNDSPKTEENTKFKPSPIEYIKYKVDPLTLLPTEEIESRSSPRMRLHLNTNIFKTRIMDPALASSSIFANNSAFRDYFKGLYFQTTAASGGTMMSLDFTKGDVTIYYKQDKVKINDTLPVPDAKDREIKSLVMTMTGNTVNLYNNNYKSTYLNALNTASPTAGDDKLYLKGGEGSVAYIDISKADLDKYKKKNYLINEATLTFTIDDMAMKDAPEPDRIYVYNAVRNTPIVDYYVDGTTVASNPKQDKYIHGGIIEKSAIGRGVQYKVRITEHLNRIINKDSTNYRLGIAVTDDIREIRSLRTRKLLPTTPPNPLVYVLAPLSTVVSPFGTVIYGSKFPDETKKIKLNIYYTKPN
jgi:Domain of unknown function (DUF4270)